MNRLWGNQELTQMVGISLEKGLSHNSRSSVMQQLYRQPLKMKMSSPSTRSSNFSSQCFTHLPPYFSIPLSQSENERDLYLSWIYISALRARISVDMISSLLFINRHSRVTPPEKTLISSRDQHIIYKIKSMIWRAVLSAQMNQTLINKKTSIKTRKNIIATFF